MLKALTQTSMKIFSITNLKDAKNKYFFRSKMSMAKKHT